MKEGRWGVFRVFLVVISVVLIGSAIFAGSQFVLRGHADDTIGLDLENALKPQSLKDRTLRTETNEAYHYDFFTLLEQPVAVRNLEDADLTHSFALRAKSRGIKLNDVKLSGKYAIQVSSFKNASGAQALVRDLIAQGYLAAVVNETVDGKGWYRVRIDGGKQREQAEELQGAIARTTGLKGFIVAL